MKSKSILKVQKQEFRVAVGRTYSSLLVLKQEGKKQDFNKLLLDVLAQVKNYVNRRMESAIHQGHFSHGKYKADDIIDQLFVEIYDTIEVVKDENGFYKWLFKKTNQLLDDIFVEEEFDDYFFKNIDDYSKEELDTMVEKFSIDGDGDLVMLEELDDKFYSTNEYVTNDFFIANEEKDLQEKLDKELTEKDLRKHINLVLTKLPLGMRNVLDLYSSEQFTIAEIAEITNEAPEEVQQLLDEAQKRIKLTFAKRF